MLRLRFVIGSRIIEDHTDGIQVGFSAEPTCLVSFPCHAVFADWNMIIFAGVHNPTEAHSITKRTSTATEYSRPRKEGMHPTSYRTHMLFWRIERQAGPRAARSLRLDGSGTLTPKVHSFGLRQHPLMYETATTHSVRILCRARDRKVRESGVVQNRSY